MASLLEDRLRPDDIPIYYPYRSFRWDQFFVGLFGALAIFGVLMKLWDEPFWGMVGPETADWLFRTFMPIGFLGECVVFIIMGFIKGESYKEVYPTKQMREEVEDFAAHALESREKVTVNMQLPESVREIIEQKLSTELDAQMKELALSLTADFERTRKLLQQTNMAYGSLDEIGQSLKQFSENMKEMDARLKSFEQLDATELSANTDRMSEQLEAAYRGMEQFQVEINRVSEKFKNF